MKLQRRCRVLFRHGARPVLTALCLAACLAAAQSCTAPGMRVSDRWFRKSIGKIVIIPLYLDRELIPVLPASLADEDFRPAYRAGFRALLERQRQLFDGAAGDILGSGRFRLTVIRSREGAPPRVRRITETFTSPRGYAWAHNYAYLPDREYLRDIARRHGADAVYFHYLQVARRWHYCYFESTTGDHPYAVMPMAMLVYTAMIYDREGNLIFDGRGDRTESYGSHVGNDASQVIWKLYACAGRDEFEIIPLASLDRNVFTPASLKRILTESDAGEPRAMLHSFR